jgi:hypothetical protein
MSRRVLLMEDWAPSKTQEFRCFHTIHGTSRAAVEVFVHLLGDVLFGFVPPVQQGGGGGSGRRAGDPEPRNDLMPYLA